MKRITRFFALATVAGIAAALATPALARSDAAFMKQAAENGHAELEASKLAQKKARSSDVKAFADTMVSEHAKVDGELKQLAASKRVDLPTGPSIKQKTELKMIDMGDDDKFDQRYAKAFGVSAHEETIKLFQEAASGATDPDVKAFAQKTLPSLQHHLEMARALDATTASR